MLAFGKSNSQNCSPLVLCLSRKIGSTVSMSKSTRAGFACHWVTQWPCKTTTVVIVRRSNAPGLHSFVKMKPKALQKEARKRIRKWREDPMCFWIASAPSWCDRPLQVSATMCPLCLLGVLGRTESKWEHELSPQSWTVFYFHITPMELLHVTWWLWTVCESIWKIEFCTCWKSENLCVCATAKDKQIGQQNGTCWALHFRSNKCDDRPNVWHVFDFFVCDLNDCPERWQFHSSSSFECAECCWNIVIDLS